MIIWGTSTRMIQIAMLSLLCAFCGNPAAHSLKKRVTKFTLFFIPLFPIAPAKHYLQCTFCGGASEVPKENVQQLLGAGTPQPGAPQPGYGQPAGGPMPPQGNPYAQQGNPYAGGQQPTHPGQAGQQQNPYA